MYIGEIGQYLLVIMRLQLSGTVSINSVSIIALTVILFYAHITLQWRCHNNEVKILRENLTQVITEFETLLQYHNRLILKLKKIPGYVNETSIHITLPDLHFDKWKPTEEYEILRRRIYTSTKELWYYVSHRLKNAVYDRLNRDQIQTILTEVAVRKRWLLLDHEKLPALDGHEEWRRRESASLSDLVQRRLQYLQNPADCRTAKKVICEHDNCGFGCSIHHIAYCLVTAYALKRTLLLGYFNWWHPLNNWTRIFHPLSDTCTEAYHKIIPYISVNTTNDTLEIYLPLSRYIQLASVKPHTIPKDLAQRISRLNGDPYSWWMGQMIKYMLKLQPDVFNNNIALKSPIVGVHIRYTDKLDEEAKYYELEDYMSHVHDYYAKLEMTAIVDQRRVYLATDNVEVLAAAIAKYPEYTFYGDKHRAQIAATRSRFTTKGLAGFLQDVHILSLCDYVVCTFSSNIGRLVLEIMQTREIDAINRITSLDNRYYFTVFEIRRRLAVMRNKKIALNVGDLIEYQCVNDAVNGTVLRTNDSGRIPWYKTEEHILQNPFPEYENVPLNITN